MTDHSAAGHALLISALLRDEPALAVRVLLGGGAETNAQSLELIQQPRAPRKRFEDDAAIGR